MAENTLTSETTILSQHVPQVAPRLDLLCKNRLEGYLPKDQQIARITEKAVAASETCYQAVVESQTKITDYVFSHGLSGLAPDDPTAKARDIENVIDQNRTFFGLPRLPDDYPKSDNEIIVDPDTFDVFIGSRHDKEDRDWILGKDKIYALTLVAKAGKDLNTLDLDELEQFAQNCSQELEVLSTAPFTQRSIRHEWQLQVEALYHEDFLNLFHKSVNNVLSGQDTSQTIEDLSQVLEVFESDFAYNSDPLVKPFYEEFVRLREGAKQLPRSERDHFIHVLNNHSAAIYQKCSDSVLEERTILHEKGNMDWEALHRQIMGFSEKEVNIQRRENWIHVHQYLKKMAVSGTQEMTLEDLRQLHTIALKGVLPDFALGFRFDYKEDMWHYWPYYKTNTIGTKRGIIETADSNTARAKMEQIVESANKLIKTKMPNAVFETALANLVSDYALVHPHPDGNGTMTLFFAEAAMALKGYDIPLHTSLTLANRFQEAFRGNYLALATMRLGFLFKEAKMPKIKKE